MDNIKRKPKVGVNAQIQLTKKKGRKRERGERGEKKS
jgi:uncharacterized protein Veg